MRIHIMKGKNNLDIDELWNEFNKSRDDHYRNLLMEHYRHLVKYAAERVHSKLPKKVELDDLISAGSFGLMDAINAYDPSRGVKFETYCVPRIKSSILDELRSMDWVPRLVKERSKKLRDTSTYDEDESDDKSKSPTSEHEVKRHSVTSENMLELCLYVKASNIETIDATEVANKFLDLYGLFNRYHISGGGNGLIIDDWQTFVTDTVPVEVLL